MEAKCKSCGADIIWIKTSTGKSHPVNVEVKRVFVKFFEDYILVEGHESHFSSCPSANLWRNKKKVNNAD